ncbi:hypothetical protein D3C87_1385190 [compost metagenome]
MYSVWLALNLLAISLTLSFSAPCMACHHWISTAAWAVPAMARAATAANFKAVRGKDMDFSPEAVISRANGQETRKSDRLYAFFVTAACYARRTSPQTGQTRLAVRILLHFDDTLMSHNRLCRAGGRLRTILAHEHDETLRHLAGRRPAPRTRHPDRHRRHPDDRWTTARPHLSRTGPAGPGRATCRTRYRALHCVG